MSYGRLLLAIALVGCAPATQQSQSSPDFSTGTLPDMAGAPGDFASSSTADQARPQGDAATAPAAATINIHYPAGSHTLALRGDSAPLAWDKGVAMPGANDVYTYSFSSLSGPVEFKPLLDDMTWAHGANYRVAPGQTVDVYPHFTATKGTVKKLFAAPFHSNLVQYDQVVWVYLPPSYDENTVARYPVLYMHDGQNLFDDASSFAGEWGVDETLDGAAEELNPTESIPEIIVIGLEAGPRRMFLYTPTSDPKYAGGDGDEYLQMIVEELKPKVDSMLRTRPEREHTGILGSSLGGLISAYASATRASTFGLTGAMSPSTWWNNEAIVATVKGMGPMRPARVYLDVGTASDGKDATDKLAAAYRQIGYHDGSDFSYVIQDGASHTEYYWAQRLPHALAFLFGPR